MGPRVHDNLFCAEWAEWAVPNLNQKYTSDPALIFILPHTHTHTRYHHFLNISDKARFITSSLCCTTFSVLCIICYKPRARHLNTRRWASSSSWRNPSSRPQAGVDIIKLTSWDLSFFHENLLLLSEGKKKKKGNTLTLGKRALRGECPLSTSAEE